MTSFDTDVFNAFCAILGGLRECQNITEEDCCRIGDNLRKVAENPRSPASAEHLQKMADAIDNKGSTADFGLTRYERPQAV